MLSYRGDIISSRSMEGFKNLQGLMILCPGCLGVLVDVCTGICIESVNECIPFLKSSVEV